MSDRRRATKTGLAAIPKHEATLHAVGGGRAPMTAAEYLNRSALRVRGWTPAMIRHLLVAPDDYVANQRNPAWPPMGLFLRARVEEAEKKPAFTRLRVAAERRRDARPRRRVHAAA